MTNENEIVKEFEKQLGVRAIRDENGCVSFFNPAVNGAYSQCLYGGRTVGAALYSLLYEGCCLAIVNLTQHEATRDQEEIGVIDLLPDERAELIDALTFNEAPTQLEIAERARKIAQLAVKATPCKRAMIGGAPYLMPALEQELRRVGIQPVYAFSKRVSIDQPQPDGSVKKISAFKFEGLVEA